MSNRNLSNLFQNLRVSFDQSSFNQGSPLRLAMENVNYDSNNTDAMEICNYQTVKTADFCLEKPQQTFSSLIEVKDRGIEKLQNIKNNDPYQLNDEQEVFNTPSSTERFKIYLGEKLSIILDLEDVTFDEMNELTQQ